MISTLCLSVMGFLPPLVALKIIKQSLKTKQKGSGKLSHVTYYTDSVETSKNMFKLHNGFTV